MAARPEGLHRRARVRLTPAAALLLLAGAVAGGLLLDTADKWTLAAFTAQKVLPNELGSALIFPGERVTPAFSVADHSSGTSADPSSPLAFAADGRHFTSRLLPVAFAADSYVEFDLNGPLPDGLSVIGAQIDIRFAADAGGATACYYVELRRASDGSLVSSHGSTSSPLACVTGTTFVGDTISLPVLSTTDAANDLRVRVYGRDTSAGPARVDLLTVSGSTPHVDFTLYPLLSRDVTGADTQLIPWGLSVP
jgi:hypothetical protein